MKELCSPNLEAGLMVNVYEDPFTEKKLEGTAKLVRKVTSEGDDIRLGTNMLLVPLGRIERWIVDFGDCDEHEEVMRRIRVHVDYSTMNRTQREDYYVELYFATHASGAYSRSIFEKWNDELLESGIKRLLEVYRKGEKLRE